MKALRAHPPETFALEDPKKNKSQSVVQLVLSVYSTCRHSVNLFRLSFARREISSCAWLARLVMLWMNWTTTPSTPSAQPPLLARRGNGT